MMNLCTDSITRSLFARLRKTSAKEPESGLLKCPKCSNSLRPLLLDFFEDKGETYQRVWWTCRGLKMKTCMFPLNMPPDVFWTKRTEEQIRHDVIPLPNFNLLPKELWHLYPFLFNRKAAVSKNFSNAGVSSLHRKQGSANTELSEKKTLTEDSFKTIPEGTNGAEILKETNTGDNLATSITTESQRRSTRKRKNKTSEPSPLGKRQLKGVVNIATVKGDKSTSSTMLHNNRRKTMQPLQERVVTGGRNFDFDFVEQSTPPTNSNRVQLFSTVQSTLKTALALRFAKKDYLDKVNTLMCESGTVPTRVMSKNERLKLLKQVSDKFPEIVKVEVPEVACEDPEIALNYSNEKGEYVPKLSFNAVHAYRNVEQNILISSRLGRKSVPEEDALLRPKSEAATEFSEIFEPMSVQSDLSPPSTSNLSVDSSNTPLASIPHEKSSANFDSHELNSLVQRHIHMLRSKSEKKKKRQKTDIEENKAAQSSNVASFHQPENSSTFDFFNDEPDYGIFSLGDDDTYGYDVFSAF